MSPAWTPPALTESHRAGPLPTDSTPCAAVWMDGARLIPRDSRLLSGPRLEGCRILELMDIPNPLEMTPPASRAQNAAVSGSICLTDGVLWRLIRIRGRRLPWEHRRSLVPPASPLPFPSSDDARTRPRAALVWGEQDLRKFEQDRTRLQRENVILTKEINDLRRKAKALALQQNAVDQVIDRERFRLARGFRGSSTKKALQILVYTDVGPPVPSRPVPFRSGRCVRAFKKIVCFLEGRVLFFSLSARLLIAPLDGSVALRGWCPWDVALRRCGQRQRHRPLNHRRVGRSKAVSKDGGMSLSTRIRQRQRPRG